MRYFFAVIASTNGPTLAKNDEAAAIDAFNEKIEAAGQRVMAAGIAAPDTARVFDNRDGQQLVTAGPVVDADDFVSGFWVIEADNDDVANALALEASRACNRRIEVRPFLR